MAATKDVKYERIVMDELPDRPPRVTQLEDELSAIKADPSLVGKAICIAQYAVSTSATGNANILRKRHGKPEAYGWWFGTRKAPNDETRTGLFVIYDPSRIVDGAAAAHEADKSERTKIANAKAKVKRDEKKAAEKAKAPAKK